MLIKEQLIRAIVIYLSLNLDHAVMSFDPSPQYRPIFMAFFLVTVLTGFHSTFVFLWMYVIIVFYMQELRQGILCDFDHVQN